MRFVLTNEAVPPLKLTLPKDVRLSKNVTVPVGVPGVIVAVNLTESPYDEGLRFETKPALVALLLTVCVMFGEVFPKYFVSPP